MAAKPEGGPDQVSSSRKRKPSRRAVHDGGLTETGAVFVAAYAEHGNATRAAIAAGYPEHTAHQAGYALLRKPEIRSAVSESKMLIADQLRVSADGILDCLVEIAFGSMGDFIRIDQDGQPSIDLDKASPEQLRAIKEIYIETVLKRAGTDQEGNPEYQTVRKVRLKLRDPKRLLELLGMFCDKEPARDGDDLLAEIVRMTQAEAAAWPIPGNGHGDPTPKDASASGGASTDNTPLAQGSATDASTVAPHDYVRPEGISPLLAPNDLREIFPR